MSDDDNNDEDYDHNNTVEGISAYFVLFSSLLALVLVLSKMLHDKPVLASILPEAGMILIVGISAGSIVNLFIPNTTTNQNYNYNNDNDDDEVDDGTAVAKSLLSFSPEIFFIALLPPIIFNSGYHLRRELFVRHIKPICLFAVLGTLISALTIAFLLGLVVDWNLVGGFQPHFTELLTFGALISATDPVSTLAVFQAKRVDPHLFYLVFGESVLNDAMGLVLFKAFAKFVQPVNDAGKIVFSFAEFIVSFSLDAIGSPLLGLTCGIGAALLFKYIDMRQSKLLELSLYVLIMYVPFLLAELIHLSGIVTILFTGMTARAFVVPNLSKSTSYIAESLFRLAAHLAETSIFLELGLSVFGLTTQSFNGKFIGWALLSCFVARAVNVYPLTFLYNRTLQRPKCVGACTDGGGESYTSSGDNTNNPIMTMLFRRNHDNNGDEKQQQQQANGNNNNAKTSGSRPTSPNNSTSKYSASIEMTDALAQSDHHEVEEMYLEDRRGVQNDDGDGRGKSNIIYSQSALAATIPFTRQDTDLSSITPKHDRDMKISSRMAHMMWFSGLRGAVAYACVRAFPNTFGHRNEFIVTTMVIVLVTTFCLGGTTELTLNWLKIHMNVDEDLYMQEWHNQRKPDTRLLQLDELVHKFAIRQQSERQPEGSTSDLESDSSNVRRGQKQKQAGGQQQQQQPSIYYSSRQQDQRSPPPEEQQEQLQADQQGDQHSPVEVLASQHLASDVESIMEYSYNQLGEDLQQLQIISRTNARTTSRDGTTEGSLFDFGLTDFCSY